MLVRYIAKLTLNRTCGLLFWLWVSDCRQKFGHLCGHHKTRLHTLIVQWACDRRDSWLFCWCYRVDRGLHNTIDLGGAVAGVPFFVCSVGHPLLKSTKKLS